MNDVDEELIGISAAFPPLQVASIDALRAEFEEAYLVWRNALMQMRREAAMGRSPDSNLLAYHSHAYGRMRSTTDALAALLRKI